MKKTFCRSVSAIAVALSMQGAGRAESTTLSFPNPGFENGATDWALQDPNSMSQVVPEAAHTGAMGLRVTDNDEKRGSSAFSAAFPVSGGQGVQLSFWARTQTASASVALWFFDANKRPISEFQPGALLEKGADWRRYQLLARAPLGAENVKVWIHSNGTGTTVVDLDDFEMKSVTGAQVEKMSLLVPPGAPPEAHIRKHPAYIVMKLDDLGSTSDGRVYAGWQRLVNFLKDRKTKSGIGIITTSLEGDKPQYFNWIRELQASGLVEFWDHGYTHKEWDENGQHYFEFKGRSYEEQKEHFARSQALAREKLGFPLAAFGPGFGATDENTLKAISEIPELKIWLYGDYLNPAGKTVFHRNSVNIEYPTFVPDVQKFIAAYNLYPQDRYFVIQGHPAMWDDARFEQFTRIVDFLISQNAVFVTPSELAALPADKLPDGTVPLPVVPVPAPVVPAPAALQLKPVALNSAPSPAAPQSLVANGDFTAPLENGWTVAGKTLAAPQIVDARIDGAPITKALHLELATTPGAQPWDARLVAARTTQTVAKGDMLLVQFWARSTPKTRFLVVYQRATDPYVKSIRQLATLRPQWQKYTFYAPAAIAYDAGGSNFEIQIGQATGKVEVAGLSVQNLGPMTVADAKAKFGAETFEYYGGEDHDDSWLPAAQARIEKYRKADLKLTVVDANGKPVQGAQVTLKETKSRFRWGTAVGPILLDQSPDGEKYRSTLKRLFNTATIENQLKWKATDNNPTTQKLGMDMLDWLNGNGFAVRGHNLVWGSDQYLPGRISKLSPEEARAAVEQRVTEAVTRTKGKVYVWDVVNEAGLNTQLWDKIGWNSFSDTFRRARAADPNALLAYNDYNIANEAPDNGALRFKVEQRIQKLIDEGVPVDVLGDQAHMGVPLTTIPRVLQIWDQWATRYKKPIEVTEFDVNVADDTIHEKYVRDFLTAAFSDPNIESFVLWGFWGKAHFLGDTGALFRSDWSPRPAALTFEDLLLNKWRTNATLKADNAGTVRTRAFLGDYEVQVSSGGKTITTTISVDKAGLEKKISLAGAGN